MMRNAHYGPYFGRLYLFSGMVSMDLNLPKKHTKSIMLIVFGTSPKKGNGKKIAWLDELIHFDNNDGLRNI